MEKRRITRREILCLHILLALAAALYLHGANFNDSVFSRFTAVIEQDGKTLHRIAFASLSETETLSVGDTVIEVGPEGARFVTSPCPDQVCVRAGLCSRAGDTAVCLPQRVSIRITGDGGADALTG